MGQVFADADALLEYKIHFISYFLESDMFPVTPKLVFTVKTGNLSNCILQQFMIPCEADCNLR